MVVCGFEGMCLKKEKKEVREWLSGGVSPCQGEGRGFESRLALETEKKKSLIDRGFSFLSCFCLKTL